MLSKFFKKESTVEEKQIIAKISYIVTTELDSPIVDIELQNYEDESINALCDIIDVLASDKSLIETVEIMKNALINDKQEDCLIKIFTRLGKHAKSKMLNAYKEKEYDEPCIKPSDAFIK